MSEREEQQGPFPSSGCGLYLLTLSFEGEPAENKSVAGSSEKAWRAGGGKLVRLSQAGSRVGLG